GEAMTSTPIRIFSIALGAALCGSPCTGAAEAAAVTERSALPVASCELLRNLDVAHTKIALAEPVAAGAYQPPVADFPFPADYSRLPAFCRVAGSIRPSTDSDIRFELWLPAAVLAGVTNAVCFSGVNSAGAKTAPPEALGVTAGIIQTVIRIGGTVGAALGIALVGDAARTTRGVAAFRSSFIVFGVAGVVMALCSIPLVTAGRRTQRGYRIPR
ncbi:MAG TPA: hypothetical protein PKV27_13655, partial [Ilumatobacteraceae bacterium]|nr:hypothetical protein [Ilumatobacteraceae bacterium]